MISAWSDAFEHATSPFLVANQQQFDTYLTLIFYNLGPTMYPLVIQLNWMDHVGWFDVIESAMYPKSKWQIRWWRAC